MLHLMPFVLQAVETLERELGSLTECVQKLLSLKHKL